jgi:hypothetical protein
LSFHLFFCHFVSCVSATARRCDRRHYAVSGPVTRTRNMAARLPEHVTASTCGWTPRRQRYAMSATTTRPRPRARPQHHLSSQEAGAAPAKSLLLGQSTG